MSTQTKFSEKDIVKTNPIFSRTRTTIESAFYANNMTHIADTATAYRLAAGNPNTIVRELVGYEACFDKAGYPKSMPRYLTEVGVERPKFWTADSPPMADKIRTIQRWCLAPAAMGYQGVYLYKHALMRTLGDPARTPEIAKAIGDLRNGLRGREVLQGAELQDGTIWIRFGDGGEMRA